LCDSYSDEQCLDSLELHYVHGSQGGEPDLTTVAKMVLHDWQRGKIPFFVPPPQHEDAAPESSELVEKSSEEGVSSDRTAAAMKAIAGIIASQQSMNVPCHNESTTNNKESELAEQSE
jgi:nuclear GTP-binding protein